MSNIELIHDDCMNVMKRYPDNYFQAAYERIKDQTQQIDMFGGAA